MKVVFHCNHSEDFPMVKSNIKNLQKFDDIKKIIILINGPAITLVHEDLSDFEDVRIEVCMNSLKSHDIDVESLADYYKPVESGVYRLAQLHRQGFSYIKP